MKPSPSQIRKQADSSAVSLMKTLISFNLVSVLLLIFLGCCTNVFLLEFILKEMPKTSSIVTFCQFLLVSVEGLLSGQLFEIDVMHGDESRSTSIKDNTTKQDSNNPRLKLVVKKTVIPIFHWFFMVLLFWSLSLMNNMALDYKIDVPLHILFKSGGLLVNMILGYFLLSKRYTKTQVISVILVTIGVVISTYSSSFESSSSSKSDQSLIEWFVGILLLSVSLIISSLLGLYQESVYKTYGKQWQEGLFYTHFLGLPFFMLLWKDLQTQAERLSSSEIITLIDGAEYLGFHYIKVPKLWFYVALNSITQYICISGVHQLSSVSSSLTVNLVLTLRKLISLLISVSYFKSIFGLGHVIGSLLVFFGTVLYSLVTSFSYSR